MKESWKHGTGYGHKVKKCICELCVKANSELNHRYYLRKGRATQLARIKADPERRRREALKYRRKLKHDILCAYGGNPPRCACCGEDKFEFLSVDHIDGNGAQHRRSLGRQNIYDILRKEQFPPGYRILCMNCNSSLGYYGYCPHNR